MKSAANLITLMRLVLSVVFFVLLAAKSAIWLAVAFFVFVAAGLTDLLDGYFARKYHSASTFGRVADPFVDKLLICGGYILLIGRVPLLAAWMVLVIVVRELFVTAMRSFVEARQVKFSATFWGKLKTFLQSLALGGCLLYLVGMSRFSWGKPLVVVLLYVAVGWTALSGLVYLFNARRILSGKEGV